MPDSQLPGELAHAFPLVARGPVYHAMMYEARHIPLTEELPDVIVILSSLTLGTHHTSSLHLLTLTLTPFLCVMVSVVTMMVTFPPPVTPHASPLLRCQWPVPASQSLPVSALWPRHTMQRPDLIVHSGESDFLFVPECVPLLASRTRVIRGGRPSVRTDRGTAVALSPASRSRNPDRHI